MQVPGKVMGSERVLDRRYVKKCETENTQSNCNESPPDKIKLAIGIKPLPLDAHTLSLDCHRCPAP